MAQVQSPPINEDVIEGFLKAPEGYNGKPRLAWILFFDSLIKGDIGNTWSPTVTNLTVSGTPTIVGIYYQNNGFTDFYIQIIPAANTTSTANSTYADLPFDVTIDGGCIAVSNTAALGSGMVVASTNRCYFPAWSAITTPVTVSGRVVTP